MADDNDKAAPPTRGPDQIIRSDTQHVVSFNERTGKATSSAGGARSRETSHQTPATESTTDEISGKDSTRVIAAPEAPIADRREMGAAPAGIEANIQKARPGSGGESIVESTPQNAIVDSRAEGWAQGTSTDRRVKAPGELPAEGNESAVTAGTARRPDKEAADVNRSLRDVRLEVDSVTARNDAESTPPREALQDTKVDKPRDGPRADSTVAADGQAAIQTTRVTNPASPSGAAQPAVKSSSRALSDDRQAAEAPPGYAAAPSSMTSRAELGDNVQHAPDDRSRKEGSGAQADEIEGKTPEAAGASAIDSEEFEAAVAAATAAAIAKLDANALLKLSLGAETVVRLSREQAESQEISQKLDAIQKRLAQSKSGR